MKKIKFIGLTLLIVMYLSCNNDNELSQQELETQNLDQMFSDIVGLASSVTCIASSEWAFTGYGDKPCGGHTGYIAYSMNINAILFLNKIDEHRNAEREFNRKWGITSDCSIPNEPTGVICENGKPVFEY